MRPIIRIALFAFSLTAVSPCGSEGRLGEPARKGHLDATFLVTADLHFGAHTTMTTAQAADVPLSSEDVQRIMIAEMNAIEGQPFPAEIGGNVGKALGLLAAGDLTDNGGRGEWEKFVEFYGLSGTEGLLKMPVYETLGNHDRPTRTVSEGIVVRHKAEHYSWDIGDLHLVCLGEPNDDDLAFLRKDLAGVGDQRPVVIYFHYAIVGPYSDDYWFGQGDHREQFAAALKGHSIVALFHGHFHGSGYYNWKGYDVFNVGAVKHGSKDFIVLQVTDDRLTVAAWNYEGKPGWWWAFSKAINDAAKRGGRKTLEVYPHPGAHARPAIPHPMIDRTTGR